MFSTTHGPSQSERHTMLWFDTHTNPDSVVDTRHHMPEYEYTVTGRTRIKKRDRIQLGTQVNVNGKQLAIFRHGTRFFAIQQICPHAGGNLAMGDIEDIDNMLCITCPRHKWPFVLMSGDCLISEEYKADRYPVEVRPTALHGAQTLFVGFPQLTQTLFYEDDF